MSEAGNPTFFDPRNLPYDFDGLGHAWTSGNRKPTATSAIGTRSTGPLRGGLRPALQSGAAAAVGRDGQ